MIVFDCGLVLTEHRDAMARMADVLGVEEDRLASAYWAHRHRYDAGQPDDDYWAAVLEQVAAAPDAALVAQLVEIDMGTWALIRPAAEQILRDLRAAGQATMVLSNAPACFRRFLQAQPWTDLVGSLVISGEEGTVKPDPSIYATVEDRAGTTEPWFVDDRQANVDAALRRGWRAHLWTSDDDTRAWLEAAGLLP